MTLLEWFVFGMCLVGITLLLSLPIGIWRSNR